ncbi:MAG: DUF4365 domain-containing protein [Thermodesulfobacteriota bacterium]
MITEEHIKEQLGLAYIRAVAAKAAVAVDKPESDYGFDGAFQEIRIIHGRRKTSGYSVNFQLKSSVNWSMDEQTVTYDLEAGTYNHLVEVNGTDGTPCVLILLCLPRESAEWLLVSEDELQLSKCCYWAFLQGPQTRNRGTVRINIPRVQQFTPYAIHLLFHLVRQGNLNG